MDAGRAVDNAQLARQPGQDQISERRGRLEPPPDFARVVMHQNLAVGIGDGDVVNGGRIADSGFDQGNKAAIRSQRGLHEAAQGLGVGGVGAARHAALGQDVPRLMVNLIGDVVALALDLRQSLPGEAGKVERGGGQHHQQDEEGYERGKLGFKAESHIPSACCAGSSG